MKFFSAILLATLLSARAAFAALPIPLTVTLNESVTVTGSPQIPVTVGSQTRYATYTSGSSTNTPTFTLTPQAGDLDLDGITIASPIDLNGGTIKDAAGNNAALTFTPPNTTGIKVNYPSLSLDFMYDADGRYTANGTVYNDLPSFLTATGGSFTRSTTASYFDSTGTLQTAAINSPRFDVDPSTLAQKGLLIEESRTNGVKNNTMQGGAAGTPGITPTGWWFSGTSGILHQIVGLGQEDGIDYIDVRFYGTTTASNVYITFGMNQTTDYAASTGAIVTFSSYLKLQAGSLSNVDALVLVMRNRGAGGSILAPTNYRTTSNLTPTTAPLRTQRFYTTSLSTTFSHADTAYLQPYIQFQVFTLGQTIDMTLRVGLPQIEAGAFASSVIKTTNAAVTRGVETLTIPTGSWHDASKGTLFANIIDSPGNVGTGAIYTAASIDDNTSANRVQLRYSYGVGLTAILLNSSSIVAQTTLSSTSIASGKLAAAYQANDFAAVANGGSLNTDSSLTLPAFTLLQIGKGAGTQHLGGHLSAVRYYPSRTSNTQLQLLTQ